MSAWGKMFLVVFFSSFLIPGMYILGVDTLFDGWVVKVVEYLLYAMILPFVAYPFFKAAYWYKAGKKLYCTIAILVGVFMPIVSGFFGVFIFEVIGSIRSLNEKG